MFKKRIKLSDPVVAQSVTFLHPLRWSRVQFSSELPTFFDFFFSLYAQIFILFIALRNVLLKANLHFFCNSKKRGLE